MFTECPFARAGCSSANIELGPLRFSFSCFLEWFSCRVAVLKHGQFDLLLVLVHSIWRARNSLLRDDKQENPIVVSRLAGLFLSDFVSAQPQTAPCPLLSPSRWSSPPPKWIMINVDASFCSYSKSGGIGVVFHDEAGTYVGGFICKIPHAIDPYTVEILAARASLHQVAQWHWRLVILESDALQVVQALHGPHCGVSTTSLLIEDVRVLLQ
ncbi:uncharacterized protein [Malus domestica]|uniref:uncharacterized protein n=1 Tax=Malus domestica TaxID=3750 RepID=UPI003975CC4A